MVTLNEMKNEWIRCYADKSRRYMIENFLRTYDNTKKSYVPFKVFPKQNEFIEALCQHDNNITTKPRQTGITTITAAFVACEIALCSIDTPQRILVIGHKLDLSQQLLQKVKFFLEQIPLWFWDFSMNTIKDGNFKYYTPDLKDDKELERIRKKVIPIRNQNQLEVCNGSAVKAVSSGVDAARGFSAPTWIIFDEAAFIENGVDVFSNAVTAGAIGCKVVMISTPCGKDPLYYDTYVQAKNKKNNFHITEFKWFQDPRYNKNLSWWRDVEKTNDTGEKYKDREVTVDPCDKQGVIPYDPERWEMLEKNGWKPTSPWFLQSCLKLNNNSQKIAQELEVSFLGSDDNVIPVEVIAFHERTNVREAEGEYRLDPVEEKTIIWKDPIPGHRYLAGFDVATGASDDNSVITILDIDAVDIIEGKDGSYLEIPCVEQVLEYHGKLPADELGILGWGYCKTYNNAFAVIDCIGSSGDACALKMRELGYDKHIYYDDPKLKDFTMNFLPGRDKTDDKLRAPGFRSSGVRERMINVFVLALKNNEIKIRSRRAITEMDTWVWKNGRADHKNGCHDDILLSLTMMWFVYLFSYSRTKENAERQKVALTSWISTTMKSANTTPRTEEVAKKESEVAKKYAHTIPILGSNQAEKQRQINPYGWLGGGASIPIGRASWVVV